MPIDYVYTITLAMNQEEQNLILTPLRKIKKNQEGIAFSRKIKL